MDGVCVGNSENGYRERKKRKEKRNGLGIYLYTPYMPHLSFLINPPINSKGAHTHTHTYQKPNTTQQQQPSHASIHIFLSHNIYNFSFSHLLISIHSLPFHSLPKSNKITYLINIRHRQVIQ